MCSGCSTLDLTLGCVQRAGRAAHQAPFARASVPEPIVSCAFVATDWILYSVACRNSYSIVLL